MFLISNQAHLIFKGSRGPAIKIGGPSAGAKGSSERKPVGTSKDTWLGFSVGIGRET
jgi:hypothetical protein